ncbi:MULTISPECIES: NrsF family protein [Sphingobium]|uniref:NrsF family protein n=1 Tax=Sphingobium TaxID=165695 RepID=UPI00159C5B43|nr:DUF1109 domain-containing protein [Sphingobium sp. 15-1]
MSNDALILRLSANLMPVKRRSPWRDAAFLLLFWAAELAAILGLGLMRPDMGQVIGSAYMLWKLGSLALLAVVSCAIAVRSFSPMTTPGRGLLLMLALTGMTMSAGALVGSADSVGSPFVHRLAPVHGLLCASSILVMSLPILAVMTHLMRRGAPTYPKGSALAAGMAAATSGALIFAFCCPVNDPLYVIIWYAAGCATVTTMARWLLPGRFRL